MDGLNTNTGSRSSATQAETPAFKNFFSCNQHAVRFDCNLMARHSPQLGWAGDLLSQSYVVSGAVATIARILHANQTDRLLERDHLDANDESHLLSAIDLLAQSLNDTLCSAADGFENELAKGGAQ
jgi:hypothetical protein